MADEATPTHDLDESRNTPDSSRNSQAQIDLDKYAISIIMVCWLLESFLACIDLIFYKKNVSMILKATMMFIQLVILFGYVPFRKIYHRVRNRSGFYEVTDRVYNTIWVSYCIISLISFVVNRILHTNSGFAIEISREIELLRNIAIIEDRLKLVPPVHNFITRQALKFATAMNATDQ